jgi:XapX domain-containing protein
MKKLYLLSLGAGVLVGIIYALIDVRSPAPPDIALIGLLGMLAGEQIPPLIKGYLIGKPAGHSWLRHQVQPHVFGHLPRGGDPARTQLVLSEHNSRPAIRRRSRPL